MKATQRDTIDTAVLGDLRWKSLYLLAGIAVFITGVFIILQMAIYFISPPPATVPEFFAQFQTNRLIGLVNLDILYVIDNLLSVIVLLAIYISLSRRNPPVMLVGTALALIGIVLIFAANPSIEMMTLSERYATATTDAGRSAFLAAGEALYAQYTGTAYNLHLLIGAIGFILVLTVMLGSKLYYKWTAITGILANALTLGYFVPGIGMFLLKFSVLFFTAWYVLIGINFIKIWQTQASRR